MSKHLLRTPLRGCALLGVVLLMSACLSTTESEDPVATSGPRSPAAPSQTPSEPAVSPVPASSGTAVSPAPAPSGGTARPAPAGAPCPVLTGTTAAFVQLTDISVTNQGASDLVVFTFDPQGTPGVSPSWEIKEVFGPFQEDPSDKPLPVAGTKFFEVTFQGASGVDLSGNTAVLTYNGPNRFTPSFPTLEEAASRSDFERVLSWVFGLNRDRCPTATVMAAYALVINFPH